MPEFDRTCFRLACLLQPGIGRLQTSDVPKCTFRQHDLMPCQQLFRKLEKARSRHLERAAAALAGDLERALQLLQAKLTSHLNLLASRSAAIKIPTLSQLYAEVRELSQEFEQTRYDLEERQIVVTTEPIELEGVALGEFEIRLALDKLGEAWPYEAMALNPHPASSDEGITHPHVKDKHLCEGDGRASLRQALATGRLADFFQIVTQVLHTYNSGSAYAELGEWFDLSCSDCGDMTCADEACACRECDNPLCSECAWGCNGCFGNLCSNCGEACKQCSSRLCDACLRPCVTCKEQFCPPCLSNGKCRKCHDCDPSNKKSGDGIGEGTREGEAAQLACVSPAAGEAHIAVHASGVGQALVPA